MQASALNVVKKDPKNPNDIYYDRSGKDIAGAAIQPTEFSGRSVL